MWSACLCTDSPSCFFAVTILCMYAFVSAKLIQKNDGKGESQLDATLTVF